MPFSGAQVTRLGLSGITRGLYGDFSGKTAEEVVEAAARHAGRIRRKRLFLEIDNQTFEVNSLDEAEHILEMARSQAQSHATSVVRREVKRRRRRGRPVTNITVPKPIIVARSPELREMVLSAQRQIDAAYEKVEVEQEIAAMLRIKAQNERDEEDLLFLL